MLSFGCTSTLIAKGKQAFVHNRVEGRKLDEAIFVVHSGHASGRSLQPSAAKSPEKQSGHLR